MEGNNPDPPCTEFGEEGCKIGIANCPRGPSCSLYSPMMTQEDYDLTMRLMRLAEEQIAASGQEPTDDNVCAWLEEKFPYIDWGGKGGNRGLEG